jgi:hypothetical protein
MHPISNDRLEHVEARIFLLGQMINEFNARQSRYQQSPGRVAVHPQVMQSMVAEQLQLNIEANVLRVYLEAEARANEARADALGSS